MIELAIALVVLSTSLLVLLGAVTFTTKTAQTVPEITRAQTAADEVLERIRSLPFDEIYVRLNGDPNDDPVADDTPGGGGGSGLGNAKTTGSPLDVSMVYAQSAEPDGFTMTTSDPIGDPEPPATDLARIAVGAEFTVPGLRPCSGRTFVGRVLFPDEEVAGIRRLREDLHEEAFGMSNGWDLDGNGVIDQYIGSREYRVLPIRIIIEWDGPAGPSRLETSMILAEM